MNTHEHLSIEILADYAEGLLGDADATSVAEHLASCADCQAEADLLVSVSTLLAADDPGPMPAHFAARIDATLAELAAAEPVTPKRVAATTSGEGAAVIDLASRRRFTPAARVTSVAASLVLLIGGVALGMQALDNTDAGNPGDNVAGDVPNPVVTSQPTAERAALYVQKEKPKGEDRKKGKNGAIIDKRDGTVFLKNKVYFTDGTVVTHKKNGESEVRTFSRAGTVERFVVPRSQTQSRPTPEASTAPDVTPDVTPQPTPAPTPVPSVDPPQKSRGGPPAVAASDPYVTNSGSAYTPDNFAPKVQALLREAGFTAAGSGGGQSSENVPSQSGQNRATAGALRSDDAAAPTRGPAPAEVAAKVKRCASQLDLSGLLAGDAGSWRGESATIVVVRNGSQPTQAVGYVVYGDCSKETPATPADVQWEMRVDFPSAEEQPNPAPTTGGGGNSTVSPSVKTSTISPSSIVGSATTSATRSQEQ